MYKLNGANENAKAGRLDCERRKDATGKIVNIKHDFRGAICKLSYTRKEPQASPEINETVCIGCFLSLCQKKVILIDSWI